MTIIQPSASRTTNPRAPIPSSKLLGYYHSSALRTDNPAFWAKPRGPVGGKAALLHLAWKARPHPADRKMWSTNRCRLERTCVRDDSYGSHDVLKCEEIEKPAPKEGEVLIKVRAG